MTPLGVAPARARYRARMLRTLNKAVMIASALAVVVAFWNRNDLPGAIDFHPKLEEEPHQRAITDRP